MAKNPKSQTALFKKMEQEEWHKPGQDTELNPVRAFNSQPDFWKHLVGAPNMAAVAALLAPTKRK